MFLKFDYLLISCVFIKILLLARGADVEYRLDKNVIPLSYDIKVTPYLLEEDKEKQFTFDGEVLINIRATVENIKTITLHKDYITIKSVQLYQDAATTLLEDIQDERLSYDSTTDKLSMNLNMVLRSGSQYQLKIIYEGVIRNGMAGVYRANYTSADGTSKWMALTQAQRIDARTIFPCFDEPEFKAKFRLQVNRPRQFTAFFNTQLVSTSNTSDTDRILDTFEWTPVMSTYLVAFIVAEYDKRGVNGLFIVTRPEFLNLTDFSYEVAERTVKAYNDYTQIPYADLGNPILQKASSPKFPHNGMENWGLVIYKDAVLVHEPYYNDGWDDKQYTIMIVVHETAHMWFGNSVTFSWWSYFWLNEAFARYYQYFLADELYPDYQLDQQFVVNQIHLIFGTDALNSTQPMTTPEAQVQSPSQIGSKFSSITYAKGASIVRMIRNLMGNTNFDAAIREYLKEYQLQNVIPENLFKHLKTHWPKNQLVNLDEFFYDWTEQVGFPVVFVNLTHQTNSPKTIVTITQKRFLLDPSDGSDPNLKYTVPITIATNLDRDFSNLEPFVYYNGSFEEFVWQPDDSLDWVILNKQQSNYYRVFYDAETLKRIQGALREEGHSGIHVINRAMLIDDLFNFGRTGMLDYSEVFEFVEYMETETEYLPWYAAFTGLKRVAERLPEEDQDNFGRFLLNITSRVYDKLGLHRNNDTILDVYNRNKVIYWACRYGHDDCNKEAQRMLLYQNRNISSDFRETLFCSGVRFGSFSFSQQIRSLYEVEENTNEQELLLKALGCSSKFYELNYIFILSSAVRPNQKVLALKPMCSENSDNVTPVFSMYTRNAFLLAIGLDSWPLAAEVIADCTKYFTTRDQLEMLETYIEEQGQLFDDDVSLLKTAAKNVESNLAWSEQRLSQLRVYLKENFSEKTGAASAIKPLCMLSILLFSLIANKVFHYKN